MYCREMRYHHFGRTGESMFVFKRIYYFIFKADERLHCQFALPEVQVVMRTDSGELFHGDEYLGLDRQLIQSLAKSQKTQLNQNRKLSGRSSKKPKTHQTNF